MQHPVKNLFLVLCLLQGLICEAQIMYVKEGGTGDGTSWENATGNLKFALDNAPTGSQVWVAAGTYYPIICTDCIHDDRLVRFQINDQLKVYGGFAGDETNLEERDVENNPTILSGNIDLDDTPWTNSYTIVYFQNVTEETVLDGFTVQDGTANFDNAAPGSPLNSGAAIFVDGALDGFFAHPVIRNCQFINHFAFAHGAAVFNDGAFGGTCNPVFENCSFQNCDGQMGGGAIYNNAVFDGECNPVFSNCTFNSNTAGSGSGGAMLNQGSENGQCNPNITNCTFDGNTASLTGGAIYNFGKTGTTDAIIIGTTFKNNESATGGAIYNDGTFIGDASPIFRDCNFEANKSTNGNGGAVYNSGIENGMSSPDFINCTFHQNESSGAGGAIFNNGNTGVSNPDFINCIFSENLANEVGGVVYNLGSAGDASPLFMNCLIYKNEALISAAGIYNLGSNFGNASPTITNCTFYGNKAPISGAVYNNASNEDGNSNTVITNCIFWNNEADLGKVMRNIWSTPTISHSIVDVADCDELNSNNGATLTCGDNMIYNQYPMFVDTMGNNFRLMEGSPAIDIGDTDATNASGVLVDLDSLPRIVEGIVDFGAFEFAAAGSTVPIITLNPQSQDVCQSEEVIFSVMANSPIEINYQWQKNGIDIFGATTNSYTIVSANPADSGEYRCIINNENDEEVVSDVAILNVTAFVDVEVMIEASATEICEGDEVNISAIPQNGGLTPHFQWQINGNDFGGSIQSFNINSLQDGDQISLTLTSSENCTGDPIAMSNTLNFTVGGLLEADIDILASAEEICEGEEVVFTATVENGGDNPVFEWFINDVPQGVNTPVFSSTTLMDADQVSCQLTSNSDCVIEPVVSSNIQLIYVSESIEAEVEIYASTENICEGEEVSFIANTINEGASPVYEWFINGMPQGIDAPSFSSAAIVDFDEITCQLTSSKDCIVEPIVSSNSIFINVSPNYVAAVAIDASVDTTICLGDTVTFTAFGDNGGNYPSYVWEINGEFVYDEDNIFVTDELEDGDMVQCFFGTSLECTSPTPAVSNVIEISVDSCAVSTQQLIADSDWSIDPNPSNGQIELTINGYFNQLNLQVLNIQGQVLVDDYIAISGKSSTIPIDLSSLETGFYFVILNNGNIFAVRKIIIQK